MAVATLEKLRIAHLMLARGFAGTERSTAESCNAQCAEHDVLLITRRGQRDRHEAGIAEHLDPRVQVVEVPARLFTRRAIQAQLERFRPDVVHAHLRRATRLLAACRTDAACVSTLHLKINGPQFLQMDGLVCISPWQLDTIPSQYRGLARLIRNSLVPHPRISAERRVQLRAEMAATTDTFLVGGVGRLAHSKGWDVLIRAFAAARMPDAQLVVIGEGRERSRLQRLAEGHPIQLPGFKSNVKDYYQAFDVFVCPSRSEPMGRVIMEALDAQVPVIASEARGPKEILSEYPGTLVPIGDVAALAEALREAHARRAAYRAVDLSAHHLERVSVEMIGFYRELIARKTAH